MKSNLVTGILVGGVLAFVGCDGGEATGEMESSGVEVADREGMTEGGETPEATGTFGSEGDLVGLKTRVVENYADLVSAAYRDSLATAETMNESLQALVDSPSDATMEAAREAWKTARVPYLQTEAFRFYGGPIDHEETGVEGLLNAWPMDEAYIDGVKGNEDAGVINDPEGHPEITAESLSRLNEKDGEANISTGYHAIEFLLWGQDFNAEGPGDRSYEDYSSGENADRRGQYLLAVGNLLVEHLEGLVGEWEATGEGNFRSEFLAAPTDESLHDIFTGIGVLSGFEVSGERLAVAYETKEQEDEHSCFSDTTHVDMIEDSRGIQNVWTGRYRGREGNAVEGPGLSELVAEKNPELATKLGEQIAATLAAAEAIPTPFDQAILGDDEAPGRVAVAKLIDGLRDQGAMIVEAAKEFGLTIQLDAG
ncbi:MAG: imelysin family protein [Chthoniobacterales bacterium]